MYVCMYEYIYFLAPLTSESRAKQMTKNHTYQSHLYREIPQCLAKYLATQM